MQLNISKTQEDLITAIADYFIKTGNAAIVGKNTFNVALAGGGSPKKLYELLATPAYKNKIDWAKVSFFFGDERYVPSNDPQSNALMVQKALFTPLAIADTQIFKVDTTLSPNEAAKKYQKTIVAHFRKKPIHFDLILLGLGDNAHTASLFPFTPVLSAKTATVKAVFLKEQNVFRITMTAPLINQAKHIAFLVFGKEKAEAVHQILYEAQDIEKYPAQLIHPIDGEVTWFLDAAAAADMV